MFKKIITAALAVSLCLGISGCSGSKGYTTVKKAQEELLNLQSGRMIVSTQAVRADKSDASQTEFSFRLTASGVYEYCQMQFDRNNKAIYCEYSDGEKSEQWLVGSGWSVSEATAYTKDNPHRYLKLLSTPIDQKSIAEITEEKEGEKTRYQITLDPKHLNETAYREADLTVKEELISILISETGELLSYTDHAVMADKSTGQESEYTLDMQISDQNSVMEIKRPDLRSYSDKPAN